MNSCKKGGKNIAKWCFGHRKTHHKMCAGPAPTLFFLAICNEIWVATLWKHQNHPFFFCFNLSNENFHIGKKNSPGAIWITVCTNLLPKYMQWQCRFSLSWLWFCFYGIWTVLGINRKAQQQHQHQQQPVVESATKSMLISCCSVGFPPKLISQWWCANIYVSWADLLHFSYRQFAFNYNSVWVKRMLIRTCTRTRTRAHQFHLLN